MTRRTDRHPDVTSLSLRGIFFWSIAVSVNSVLKRLPSSTRRKVQWSQIWLNVSEPHVVQSSWKSFPVWWRLANHSSNCTECDVAKESQALFRCRVGKQGTPRHCRDFCICYMTSVRDPQDLVESICFKCIYLGTWVPCCGPSYMPREYYATSTYNILLLLYSQTHLGRVSTDACFILYIVSKRNQTNDIHLSGYPLREVWPYNNNNNNNKTTTYIAP